jgi:hypothetical protein
MLDELGLVKTCEMPSEILAPGCRNLAGAAPERRKDHSV